MDRSPSITPIEKQQSALESLRRDHTRELLQRGVLQRLHDAYQAAQGGEPLCLSESSDIIARCLPVDESEDAHDEAFSVSDASRISQIDESEIRALQQHGNSVFFGELEHFEYFSGEQAHQRIVYPIALMILEHGIESRTVVVPAPGVDLSDAQIITRQLNEIASVAVPKGSVDSITLVE